MVKARRQQQPESTSRRTQDIVGLCLFVLGACCLMWLAWRQGAVVPDGAADVLRLLAGSGAYAIPVIMMFVGSMYLVGYQRLALSSASYGSILLFITYVTWRHLLTIQGDTQAAFDPNNVKGAGGYIGAVVGTIFYTLLRFPTSYILLFLMACIAVVLIVDKPFMDIVKQLHAPADAGLKVAKQGVAVVKQKGAETRDGRAAKVVERAIGKAEDEGEAGDQDAPKRRKGLFGGFKVPAVADDGTQLELPMNDEERVEALVKNVIKPVKGKVNADPVLNTENVGPDDFKLPPLTLLKESPPAPKRAQSELTENIKTLEQTLDQFGIDANVVEIAHGPTVTRYEIQLGPGIKVAKIVSLADNLAMALAAIDVRVEAPIPGKSAIGIEVPNPSPAVVSLRECLDTPEFQNAPSKLTFALGKDVAGQFRYADLTCMPHLLIGGSTNSGKSVALNTLIASMLYRNTPRELKFLMIDPKRVELSLWDGIPHLMHPVVKDVKQAAGIFRAALKEMERRYDLFSRIGTRNIEGYNQQVDTEEKLPFLVVVVDELADLMMQAAAEIETSICRLAQLARATGIHLVIATQRPSVDVITGVIKANISSRIAFAVSSNVDSRTILDHTGAERLIGRGDMLFLPIDASKAMRVQGCYLSEAETHTLVNYLKEQEKPNYTILPVEVGQIGGGAADAANDDQDELYEAAVKLVVTNGQASTSMLQRRFKIGYTRAARLVDMMEARGIVGPLDGAKPREILVSKDEIDRMFWTDTDNDRPF